jgi:hypothetical protein
MLEREARNKYLRELGGALVIYTVVLYFAITNANANPQGSARTLWLLAPIVPVFLAVWAIARHFRRMDEFVRLRSYEGLALGAAVTAAWTFTYGFLEIAGFPKITMFWIWPSIGAVWFTHSIVTRVCAMCAR